MKTLTRTRQLLAAAALLAGTLSLQSCLDDDNNNYQYAFPNALVTVKQTDNNTFFLQLDDRTTLLPVNVKESPFGDKEVRALVNYNEVNEPCVGYDQAIHINWIDSILTKPMVPNLAEENNQVYGKDPVEIVNDWVTIAEDGYLTLRFRTRWGGQATHFVNLISTNNPENPYEVEFRHNAYGDLYGMTGDGLVAFRLDQLPDTQGETVKLKLKWNSFSGEKSAEFDYCTRQSTPASSDMAATRSELSLK